MRDREFCSASHRKSYKERLGRVIHQISEEELPPPPPAGFLTKISPAEGNVRYTIAPWLAGHDYPLHGITHWPFTVPDLGHLRTRPLSGPSLASGEAEPVAAVSAESEDWVHEAAYPELELDADMGSGNRVEFETAPPACGTLSIPLPEIAERWLDRSLSGPCDPAAVPLASGLENLIPAALDPTPVLCGWQPAPAPEPAAAWVNCIGPAIPFAIAPVLHFTGVLPPPVFNTTPAQCGVLPIPAPEPAATWLNTAAALTPIEFAIAPRIMSGLPLAVLHTTPELAVALPTPEPEPMAAWLATAEAAQFLAFAPAALARPAFTIAAELEPLASPEDLFEIPAACDRPIISAANPASGLGVNDVRVSPAASIPVLQLPGAVDKPTGAELPLAGRQRQEPVPVEPAAALLSTPSAASALAVRLPAALGAPPRTDLPVAGESRQEAALIQPSVAIPSASPSVASHAAPVAPVLPLAADLEPLADELLEIPDLCDRPIASLRPEPVWNFLSPARASELPAAIPPARPVLAAAIQGANVPMATAPRLGLQPEPVMAGVWPHIAETPLESIGPALAFGYPEFIPAPAALHGFDIAAGVACAAAEPVEALRSASFVTVRLSAGVPLELPAIAAVSAAAGRVSHALPVAGPQAQPAETWIAAASAGPMTAVKPPVMQAFQVEGISPAAIPVPEAPPLAAAAAEPEPAAASTFDLQPVPTLKLVLPTPRHQRATPAIPRPSVVAIEYHTQRTRGVAYSRPEWKSVAYQPLPPSFSLRAALDNPEDLIKPKAPLAGVFPINARSQRNTRSAAMQHILRVAAAVLIVTTIWTGAQALKNARRISVREDDTAFATPNRVLTPESQKAAANKAAEGKGPVNWLRHTVANRASVQVADDFQSGMQRWGATAGTLPANWHRNRDGYVNTGALAIFAPTAKFSDYKLEFFGQIENKGLGWVVRAKDDKNYHAMKFTVIERGLRPIIAMVHYDVIDGQAGRRTQIPLNVMVHNNRPFQVAVTLKGKHFVTEVDGEEVDNYREELLPTGGIGFFSEAGEQARLYWARVTKNDDWLGHVCAFLSGGEAQATAELWPPSVPGGAPAPWTPAGDSPLLTAAWIGLPSIRRTQSPRRQKRCNR